MACRFSIVLAAVVLGGLLGGSAALAQEKQGFERAPKTLLQMAPEQRAVIIQATKMVCFWKDYNAKLNTPFGASGFCPQSSDAAVGDPCACNTADGGLRFGKSIEAPAGDGSSQVVR